MPEHRLDLVLAGAMTILVAVIMVALPCAVRAQEAGAGEKSLDVYLLPADKLVAKARDLIAKGKHVDALTLLDLATMKAEGNADAWFLAGKIHVEHVSTEDGIAALEKCKALEPKRPGLHLWLGRGYLDTGKTGKAIEALLQERAISGDSPELAFRLAIAYMDQQKWDQALAELRKVPDTGTPFSGRKHFNLGLIALRRGKTANGVAAVRRSVQEEKDPVRKKAFQDHLATVDQGDKRAEELSREILDMRKDVSRPGERRRIGRPELIPEKKERKPLKVTLDLGFEFDDNVSLINTGMTNLFVPPVDVDRHDTRFVADLLVDWRPLQKGTLGAGVRLSAFQSAHFDQDEFDYSMGTVSPYVEWKQGPFTVDLHPFCTYAGLGGNSYESHGGFGVSGEWRQTDWTFTQVFYRFARRVVFLETTSNPMDRDGIVNDIGVYQTIDIANLGLRLYGGFEHHWERTTGRDYDYNAPKLVVGAGLWLPLDVYGSFEYSYLHEDYENANSLDNFEGERDDRRNSYLVRLARRITDNIDMYVEYRHMHNVSNINTFTFKSNVIATGIIIRF